MAYFDRNFVLALVGNANVVPIWDLDADNVEDVGLMAQDGAQADAYIDRFLAVNGITVPVTDTTPVVVQSLKDISAHLTVWWGYHHRGIEELSRGLNRSPSDIGGLMAEYKDYADQELAKLLTILQNLDPTDTAVPAGAFQFIPRVRPCFAAADENARPLFWPYKGLWT